MIGQDDIKRLHRMSLALYVAVATGIGSGCGRYPEDAVIEDIQNVDTGEAPTRMPGSGVDNRPQQIAAVADRFEFEVVIGHQ